MVRLEFNPRAPLADPDGPTLLDWVKEFPGRRWNAGAGAWDVTGFASEDPYRELRAAGFEVSDEHGTDPRTLRATLAEYRAAMLAKVAKSRTTTIVRPRLMPYDEAARILGPGAEWDKTRGRFEVPTTDLIDADGGWPFEVEFVTVDAAAIGRELHRPVLVAAPTIRPEDVVIPAWFGLDLYPFQREGIVEAVAHGKTLIADPPGLGKTRQGLGVCAVTGAARTVIVTPPVMLTGWQREADAAGIAHAHDAHGAVTAAGAIVVWSAGKKIRPVPDRGVVIVSDSLLAARPELCQALALWHPDALIVDEAHRQKGWSTKRSKVIRALAGGVDGPRMALTGTPLFANPVELAGVMAITGHLTTVFGGYTKFVIRYAQQNKFKAWMPRKRMLPELRRRLYADVWVRREREDVLDLPPMSRHTLYTDVDLRGFNQAHKDVIEKIDAWIAEVRDALDRDPDRDEVHDFAANHLELVTMLRRAAGLAKIDAAAEIVRDWVQSTPKDESTREWPSPLILWTHHRTVTAAMYEAACTAAGDASAVRVIDGGTKQDDRTVTVDDFQAGQVAVLVASITAAGVGITLTRSTDAIYVETDWTPALIQQADFRQNRIGQTKPTRVTTMVAPGTLDEYIHGALAKKGAILGAILGGDHDVSADIEDGYSTPIQIITDMVNDRLAGRAVSNVRSKTRRRKPSAIAA